MQYTTLEQAKAALLKTRAKDQAELDDFLGDDPEARLADLKKYNDTMAAAFAAGDDSQIKAILMGAKPLFSNEIVRASNAQDALKSSAVTLAAFDEGRIVLATAPFAVHMGIALCSPAGFAHDCNVLLLPNAGDRVAFYATERQAHRMGSRLGFTQCVELVDTLFT